MIGPSEVSVARIAPDLAERSWADVHEAVVGDNPGGASDDLRCFIAVFGHGKGIPESIDRVRRTLAARTPPRLSRHIAVQAAPSTEPDRDKPGTLYMNWLFKPGTPDELAEDIYMHTLTLAIVAAIRRTPRARVIWPKDDEIAARVMTAAAPPKGGVQ